MGVNEGDRFVIQYFEPSDSTSPAIGLDIASEPNRRAAAERAMQTGEAAMTAPIALVQPERAPRRQRSVLLLLPLQGRTQLGRLQQRQRRSAAARGTPDETIGWI